MMSMYNYCDDTVHFKRRKCSTSPAVGVQLERYIHAFLSNKDVKHRAIIILQSNLVL